MKRILVPLAEGFEEAEFIGIADVLKRASLDHPELEVITASLTDHLLVKGAHGIKIQAETSLSSIALDSLDAIALPGGFDGMNNLKNSPIIIKTIQELHAKKKLIAAICASPIVLNHAGVLRGDFTCYPGCEAEIPGTRKNQAIVVSQNIITSAGPGTAILFGLEIVRYLLGNEAYQSLYEGLLIPLLKSSL
ncbi:DJ-1 family glyoxalase III [Helicobacter mustelae]|uniref:4-methyl-5(Beta-hydroxyethyl)-thiazole monophosphate synthesis protein n=1 Tax=Helicobacter mustelae (strain ATCC 43772 / CCUG 25715 / CIP 103759 / LMG 18044 / NCTC 12198 / R85-136P) TaxID=679897 RepID=D3UH09_HELM1|nr:DJ-1 family glyoxalase III [Helicobacter mustelae]CBG39781.1 4-methyl-5(beta-hydroxyethyl)-thiazole monophosphate synthesis protein [Helicobacter mustelae 12198]SQH71290.1 4-methyl-5(beta-hydroxyethyl)-thiazole monophosphate synthesis protein [Helicobacter mustelae]STP12415.1 4-methyl-5(beta-hydroxyethyl)-thiazole monophosphate synthesis protein [Helicobacter mustelae]